MTYGEYGLVRICHFEVCKEVAGTGFHLFKRFDVVGPDLVLEVGDEHSCEIPNRALLAMVWSQQFCDEVPQ